MYLDVCCSHIYIHVSFLGFPTHDISDKRLKVAVLFFWLLLLFLFLLYFSFLDVVHLFYRVFSSIHV